jgi:hypothetical protein
MKCFTSKGKLIAEYEIMENGDVKEIYLDSLFREAFRLAYRNGVKYARMVPYSKYNTPDGATPAEKIAGLIKLYEGEYKYRCEWS